MTEISIDNEVYTDLENKLQVALEHSKNLEFMLNEAVSKLRKIDLIMKGCYPIYDAPAGTIKENIGNE